MNCQRNVAARTAYPIISSRQAEKIALQVVICFNGRRNCSVFPWKYSAVQGTPLNFPVELTIYLVFS